MTQRTTDTCRRLLAVFGALAIAAATAPACASGQRASPAPDLLRAGEYEQLDRQLSDLQRGYAQRTVSELDLLDAFRQLYVVDPALERRFDEWISRHPRSYVALLARGIYYKRIGMEYRGDRPASRTAPEQMDLMESYFAKAMADFEASLEFEAQPILTYLYMMDIKKHSPNRSIRVWLFRFNLVNSVESMFREAISFFPNSFILRRKYMLTLLTRWGGSVRKMSDFLTECRQANLEPEHLRALESLVLADEGWVRLRSGDPQGALRAYRRSLELVDPADPQLFEYGMKAYLLHEVGYALQQVKDYGASVEYLSQAIDAGENEPEVYLNRGISLANLGKKKEALEDYLEAAKRGDARAQNEVGVHYWHGVIVPQDREEALKWFSRSAEQGFETGVKHFEWAKKVLSPRTE